MQYLKKIELRTIQRILLSLGVFWQLMGYWTHRYDLFLGHHNSFDTSLNFSRFLTSIWGIDFFWWNDGKILLFVGFVFCISLLINYKPKISSFILLNIFLITFARNNLILNLGCSIASWLLLVEICYGVISKILLAEITFYFTSTFYALTGLWKISSTEFWRDGTLMERLIYQSGSFHSPGKFVMGFVPLFIWKILTWIILYGEILYFFSIFVPKTRKVFWWLFFLMHFFLMLVWPAEDVSFTLISLQLVSYYSISEGSFLSTFKKIKTTIIENRLRQYILAFVLLAIGLYRPLIEGYYLVNHKIYDDEYFHTFYSFIPASPAILMFSDLTVVNTDSELEVELISDKIHKVNWSFLGPFRFEVWNANYSFHRMYWALAGYRVPTSKKFNLLGERFIKNYFCTWPLDKPVLSFKMRFKLSRRVSEPPSDWINFNCRYDL